MTCSRGQQWLSGGLSESWFLRYRPYRSQTLSIHCIYHRNLVRAQLNVFVEAAAFIKMKRIQTLFTMTLNIARVGKENKMMDYAVFALIGALICFFIGKALLIALNGDEMGLTGDDLIKRYLFLKRIGRIK